MSFCVSNADDLILGDGGALAAVRRWNQIAIDASGFDHATSAAQPGPGRSSRAMAIIHVAISRRCWRSTAGTRATSASLTSSRPCPARPPSRRRRTTRSSRSSRPRRATFDASLAADLALVSSNAAKASGVALGQRCRGGHPRAANGRRIRSARAAREHRIRLQRSARILAPGSDQPAPARARRALGRGHAFRVEHADAVPRAGPSGDDERRVRDRVRRGEGGGRRRNHDADDAHAGADDQGIYWAYDGTPSLCAPPRLYNQIAILIGNQQGLDAIELGAAARGRERRDGGRRDRVLGVEVLLPALAPDRGHPRVRPRDGADRPRRRKPARRSADQTWTPLGAPASNTMGPNFTPPFPTYPSGHATFGGTLFQVMRRFFGTDDIAFTFVSDEFNGVTLDNQGTPRPSCRAASPTSRLPRRKTVRAGSTSASTGPTTRRRESRRATRWPTGCSTTCTSRFRDATRLTDEPGRRHSPAPGLAARYGGVSTVTVAVTGE